MSEIRTLNPFKNPAANTPRWWMRNYLKLLRNRWLGSRVNRDKRFVKEHYADKGTRDIDGYFKDQTRGCMIQGQIQICHSRLARDQYLQAISLQIAECGAKRVLEVGCGTSLNLYLLSQEHPEVEFQGIDITPERIETGKRWFAEHKQYSPNVKVGDVTKLEFDDASVDLVFSVHCFEQIDSYVEAGLREVCRVASQKAVLLEPDYLHSNAAQRLFLRNHSYLLNFDRKIENVAPGRLAHTALDTYINPLNRTGLFVVNTDAWPNPPE